MKECVNQKKNLLNCNCSYDPCSRKGICCECLAYHLRSRQVPACFFSASAEKSYDRSLQNFIRDQER